MTSNMTASPAGLYLLRRTLVLRFQFALSVVATVPVLPHVHTGVIQTSHCSCLLVHLHRHFTPCNYSLRGLEHLRSASLGEFRSNTASVAHIESATSDRGRRSRSDAFQIKCVLDQYSSTAASVCNGSVTTLHNRTQWASPTVLHIAASSAVCAVLFLRAL